MNEWIDIKNEIVGYHNELADFALDLIHQALERIRVPGMLPVMLHPNLRLPYRISGPLVRKYGHNVSCEHT